MKEALSHRQLQSLIQVSNVLNSSLDIDTIIDSIMEQTVSVIDAADGGVLFLYDPDTQLLVPHSSHGFKSDIVRQIRMKPGESMTGLTFSARQSLIFPNRNEVMKAMSTLSEENQQFFKTSTPIYPYSTMCAPILSQGDCIGVITLDSFKEGSEFTQEDMNLLRAISHQSAVALEKANLYQEKEQTVRKLEFLNQKITQQNNMLSRSFELHNHLADLVLTGQGVDAIIKYIYQTIDQHTFLFDDLGELIASNYGFPFSPDVLDLIRVKTLPFIESLDHARTRMKLDVNGDAHHMVVLPIGSKPKLLGALTLLAKEEIGDVDLAALEHACTVLSLELMKERAIFDAKQRLEGELIDELFSGKTNESIIQKAKHLNFDLSRNYMALLINVDEFQNVEENQQESIIRHLVQIVSQVFLGQHTQGIVVNKHHQIIMLLSFHQKITASAALYQTKEHIKYFFKEIQEKNWRASVSVGIGRIKPGLAEVHKSFQEASKCIQFIRSYQQKNQVISYSELGVQRLLLQNSEEELLDFIHEVLGPLIEYEKSRKGDLLATLFLYLEHNQNTKDTAESMHIHVNTLIYRLKRMEEILSFDMTDSKQFLNIHLAVSLYQYLKEKINEEST